MDAYAGLLRLDWINVIFGLAAFFTYGEDAQRRDCLKWVVGLRMHHAHTNGREVAGVNNGNYHDERDEDALRKYADWGQTTIPPRK